MLEITYCNSSNCWNILIGQSATKFSEEINAQRLNGEPLFKGEDIVQTTTERAWVTKSSKVTNFDRHALYDIMQGTYQETNQGPSDRYKYYAKSTDVPAGGRSLLLGKQHLDALGALGSQKAIANYSDQIPPQFEGALFE